MNLQTYPLADSPNKFHGRLVENHGELLAVDFGGEVAASYLGRGSLRECAQDLVADGVAVRVVDRLEAIKIE